MKRISDTTPPCITPLETLKVCVASPNTQWLLFVPVRQQANESFQYGYCRKIWRGINFGSLANLSEGCQFNNHKN